MTEARDADGIDFGIERLRKVIQKHRNATTEEMVNSISEAVNDFTGPDILKDDVTIMVARKE